MIIEIFVFIFGSCIGSFLNVCIHRLPKSKSLAFPGSFCPKCKKPIKFYDNIPILSYLFLRGRCRKCSEKISLRYPIVELITAIFFLVLYLKLGLTLELAKFVFLFSVLVVVSFIDIDYHAIPIYLCFIGITGGLLFVLWPTCALLKTGVFDLKVLPLYKAFAGLLFGFGFTYAFKFFGDIGLDFYLKFRKQESIEGEKESLGLGDVDFMGMVGVFLGVKAVVLVFFIAPFIALLYSAYAIFFKKTHLIPYLPYLSLATVITFFWGNKILSFVM
ncbi:MAG: prepilin peptidase [Candidatus Omnitrophica bacterium]|nr:prepilin peptidase [Candidatus Omnitrophota bacterium]